VGTRPQSVLVVHPAAYPLASSDPAYNGREVGRIPVVNIDVDFRGPREPAAVESRRGP
jgi:hypothetical protein